MGKRELLLVLGFVVIGTAVYHMTARPSAEGSRQFSLSAVVEHVRRTVRGNRASAEVTSTDQFPLADATTEVRIAFVNSSESLTIVGEDRTDIASELHVSSTGYDDAEAQRLARTTVLKASEAGARITFTLSYPPEARQRATVTLRVPAKLRVGVVRYSGKLSITKTAGVELLETRGDTTLREVAGQVSGSHRNGDLTLADIAALKINVRSTDLRLSRVRGDVSIQAQNGEVNASELEGAVDIESNSTDVSMERLERLRAPVHVTASNGSVKIRGIRSETRIDARNAEVILSVAQPVAVAVYADGGEDVEITPPPGGYRLDAVATAGRITVPEGLADVKVEGAEQRAVAAVNGGGPTLTLRGTHGEIVVRSAESPLTPEAPPRPPAPPSPPAPKTLQKLEPR